MRQQAEELQVVVEAVVQSLELLQYLEEPEVAVELQPVEEVLGEVVQQRVAEFGELQQY